MSSPVAMSPVVPVQEMEFGEALKAVLSGRKITRKEWNSDECVFLVAGYLHIRKSNGTLHILQVSEGDILGTDWVVVREN